MKQVSILVLFAAIIGGAFLISKSEDGRDYYNGETLKVVTSFYPLTYFTQAVGGDRVEVKTLTPMGGEVHMYEPSARDVREAERADLFILNGMGVDPMMDDLARNLEAKNVPVLEVSRWFQLQNSEPHIWLNPVMAKWEVEVIRDTLKEVDPANVEVYEGNAEELLAELTKLDEDYKAGLANCTEKSVVVDHAAFDYLGKRYGVTFDWMPSFFATEEQPVIDLNPIETLTRDDERARKDYIDLMQENLEMLHGALGCS